MKKQKVYEAVIEIGKDQSYDICTKDWGHIVVGTGSSIREAKQDFAEAISELADDLERDGNPTEANELRKALSSVVYSYDVRSFLKYYKLLNLTQFARYIGINEVLMRQYKAGQYMSEERAREIERGFRRVAEDLSAMSL